ncbi:MAG: peptidylprolyl isomerase [Propionivibrio sp.]
MQKLTQIAAALAIGASISVSALAADKAFVKVNGASVSQNLADAFIAEQKAKGAPDSPELRNAIREELIRRELLLQEAKKSGLDKKPDIAAQAEAAKQAILIRSYVQDYVNKHPIKDEQLQSDYDKIKAQVGSTEYKARHILVKEEAEAKTVIENLKKGVKFEELAKQSIDPGSKENGGELDWAAPSNYVKPFADALTALGKGKYTETPVKSDFGYHVIMLDDTRATSFPSFDEVKPRLLQQAQTQQITKMVDSLRAKAKVE